MHREREHRAVTDLTTRAEATAALMPAGDEALATRKHRVCPTQTSGRPTGGLQRTCSHCSKLSSLSCEQCRTSAPIASSPIEVYAASNTWAVGARRWCSRGRPASGEQLRCAAQLARHSAARACSRAQRSASRCMTWSLSPSTCAIRRVLSRRSWQEIWSKAYGQLAHFDEMSEQRRAVAHRSRPCSTAHGSAHTVQYMHTLWPRHSVRGAPSRQRRR